jgi:chitosanase
MLNATEKLVAQALVNISETGSVRGRYSAIAVIPGDAGHLTYGRSQTTLVSGGLAELVRRYVAREDARDAEQLRPYLERLEARDLSLDGDAGLKSALRVAGSDPAMQEEQDAYFDERFWDPAERAAEALGLSLPLSIAVVYDSFIQGAWGIIRDRVLKQKGHPGGDEHGWVAAYCSTRASAGWTPSRPSSTRGTGSSTCPSPSAASRWTTRHWT